MAKYFNALAVAACLGLLLGSSAEKALATDIYADDMFQDVEDSAGDSDANKESGEETMPQEEDTAEDELASSNPADEESVMDGIKKKGPPIVARPGGMR